MHFSDLVKTYNIPDENLQNLQNFLNKNKEVWGVHEWSNESKEGRKVVTAEKNIDKEPNVLRLPDCILNVSLVRPFLLNYTKNFYYSTPTCFSSIRLNRYIKGQRMLPHVDHITSLFKSETRGIPVLSIVGLINKAKVGGEFIMTFPDKTKKEYLNKEGTVIVFPSVFIYQHEITPVIDGIRDSYVSWAHY